MKTGTQSTMDVGGLDAQARPKRVYAKPLLNKVALRPDEAVLGNCKTASTSGPAHSGSCQAVTFCSSQGS